MIKLIIIFLIILLVGAYFIYTVSLQKIEEIKQVFQGPVPEGYDEEHFRETGETKPLGENE